MEEACGRQAKKDMKRIVPLLFVALLAIGMYFLTEYDLKRIGDKSTSATIVSASEITETTTVEQPTVAPTKTPTPQRQDPTPPPAENPSATPTSATPTSDDEELTVIITYTYEETSPAQTQAPTATPAPIATPTQAPTAAPTPTQAPTQAPTATPTPAAAVDTSADGDGFGQAGDPSVWEESDSTEQPASDSSEVVAGVPEDGDYFPDFTGSDAFGDFYGGPNHEADDSATDEP